MPSLKLYDALSNEMLRNLADLSRIGVLRVTGKDVEFDKVFRDSILEDAGINLENHKCKGSQCETRDSIREAVIKVLIGKGVKDSSMMNICAELFIVEHGKTPADLARG